MSNLNSSLPLKPLRLFGAVQSYAWGKVGAASRIADILPEYEPGEPLAEYWLGAHPKGSALVELPGGERVLLSSVLADPAELPFMLKVLSINGDFALSIQSHPDSATARVLHARNPESYPDPFHKPEVGVALTPVRLLYGFKGCRELIALFNRVPELRGLISSELFGRLLQEPSGDRFYQVMRDLFAAFMRCDAEIVAAVVRAITARVANRASEVGQEELLMSRLARVYGDGDVGLVALYLMNIVDLAPGSGIFIDANIPHAYLEGDLVECMACSDNVIRAGLTPKFRDVETLLETCRYDVVGEPRLVRGHSAGSRQVRFDLPVEEFALGMIGAVCGADAAGDGEISTADGHVIAFSVGAEAKLWRVGAGDDEVSLIDGGAVLLPRNSGVYRCATRGGAVFVAGGRGVVGLG